MIDSLSLDAVLRCFDAIFMLSQRYLDATRLDMIISGGLIWFKYGSDTVLIMF
jgi:hypothetical protein